MYDVRNYVHGVLNICILLLLTSSLYGQLIDYAPFGFKNYTPAWQVVLQDTTIELGENRDGYNHIRKNEGTLIENDVLYVLHATSSEWGIAGYHASAIDLKTGEVRYTHTLDNRSSDRQEYPMAHTIDDQGRYVVYTARRIDAPIPENGTIYFFGFRGDSSHLARRVYDGASLLEEHLVEDSPDKGALVWRGLLYKSILALTDEVPRYYDFPLGNYTLAYDIDSDGQQASQTDSIKLNYILSYEGGLEKNYLGLPTIGQISKDSIVFVNHAHARDRSKREATLYITDASLQVYKQIDLLEKNPDLPFFRDLSINYCTSQYVELEASFLSQTGQFDFETWFVDYEGKLILRVPSEIEGVRYTSSTVRYDAHIDAYVILAQQAKHPYIDVYTTSGERMTKVYSLEIDNPNHLMVFSDFRILEGDRYLISGSVVDKRDVKRRQGWDTYMLLDDVYESLHLTSSTGEYVDAEVDVYPSPTSGAIYIDGCLGCAYSIWGTDGSLILKGEVDDKAVHIPQSGMYYIHLMSGSNRIVKKILVTR